MPAIVLVLSLVLSLTPQPAQASDTWNRLAQCESGRRAAAHSSGGRYHGALQFDLQTWRSVGESGDPHTYSYDHQIAAGVRLQRVRGWKPWPACARKLHLR